jgi:hypothetical protein
MRADKPEQATVAMKQMPIQRVTFSENVRTK